MNTNELERCIHTIGYWMNEDETVIDILLSNETSVVKDYADPFKKELNTNLLSKDTYEAKRDLLKYYIFEFWELQGFFKEFNEILFTGALGNYTPTFYKHTSENQKDRKLTEYENYAVNSWIVFDILFNDLQLCCIKYNIDFLKLCDEVNFLTKYIDCGITLALKKPIIEDFPTKPIPKQKPKLTSKQITFNSSETIKKLHKELKGCFPQKEAELLKVLKGKQLTELLLFPHNQNKFVEVFRRLKYNGFLLNTDTETKDWICSTFHFKKRGFSEPQPFKESSVWGNLNKGQGEPTKKERICIMDWLPYKSPLQLSRDAENEKL